MADDRDKIIYMDNAAGMRIHDDALAAMLPYYTDIYSNPQGAYDFADEARKAVALAREGIAGTLGASVTEIYFTSGGTESDNWALRSAVEIFRGYGKGNPHIIVSAFEHHAVLNTCRLLEKEGVRVSLVKPDREGFIDPLDVEAKICSDTALISVMMINNETGTIQPVDKIAEAAHKRGVLFHTDAVAAYGHIPIDVRKMDIDLLSASSHKFGGPKGAGFLYVRENLKLPPLIVGGSQERGRRGGSENVPGIIGMAAAAGIMHGEMDDNLARRKELDSYFIRKLKECPFEYRINGPLEYDGGRLPGSFNITLTGMNAEELIVRLGRNGICISAGAACTSSNDEGSHVLKAMGLAGAAVRETIRITLSENNTIDEIDKLFTELCKLGGRS